MIVRQHRLLPTERSLMLSREVLEKLTIPGMRVLTCTARTGMVAILLAGPVLAVRVAQATPGLVQSAESSVVDNPAVQRALAGPRLGTQGETDARLGASSEFQVNTYTTGYQWFPAVAMDSDGDFVAVWQSNGSSGGDTSLYSIQGQRFDTVGVPQGAQFQINTYTTNHQTSPAVAMDNDGDFVVVWQSYGSSGTDASTLSIQSQRYNAGGTAQGSQFQVNTYTTGAQYRPAVAIDSDGDFVVVWHSGGSSGTDASGYSIQGQRYNSNGTAQGSEFQINTYTTLSQRSPAVAMNSDGDFVVVWHSNGSSGTDTSVYSIQGQRYNSNGTTQGSQFQINTYTTGHQTFPAVALDSIGDFVVVWESNGSSETDSSSLSIQGQRYNTNATAQGSEFQVNTYTTGDQMYPAVAMDSSGDFVVVWLSEGSSGTDADGSSIQGQRYPSFSAPDFQIFLPVVKKNS